jgi:hypothetical protein
MRPTFGVARLGAVIRLQVYPSQAGSAIVEIHGDHYCGIRRTMSSGTQSSRGPERAAPLMRPADLVSARGRSRSERDLGDLRRRRPRRHDRQLELRRRVWADVVSQRAVISRRECRTITISAGSDAGIMRELSVPAARRLASGGGRVWRDTGRLRAPHCTRASGSST